MDMKPGLHASSQSLTSNADAPEHASDRDKIKKPSRPKPMALCRSDEGGISINFNFLCCVGLS